MNCNIDLSTNTDCADESVERVLLVDDNQNCLDGCADNSEALKHGGEETKQRRREENMSAHCRISFRKSQLERARDDMFSTRVVRLRLGLERSLQGMFLL